jgi:hypothetical protein
MATKGAILAMIGKDDVDQDDADPQIQDPSEDLARAIAGGLAEAKGGLLANGPIARDQWRGPDRQNAVETVGARYVVEVAPAALSLSYFSLDWRHYDITFGTTAQVIDPVDGRVVSKAKCFVGMDHSAPLLRRHELLENHAEKLRAAVAKKASACLAKLEAGLDLPAGSRQPLMLAANPATPSAQAPGGAGVVLVSDASAACDADKRRYAAELGVSCSSLGAQIAFPNTTAAKIE